MTGRLSLCRVSAPGMANAHCHAFHRALRGRTHRGGGTFWTWREDMYGIAARLTPDSYHALARALYAEMALAGISCVGEFHYVHHGQGGSPYRHRNAMGDALLAAAYPSARRLLDAGVTVALAADCNPGSSYTSSMPFCIAIAVREMHMTPDEAVWAATMGGARALRRTDIGQLVAGVWQAGRPASLTPTV